MSKDLIELQGGVYYKYVATLNSWVKFIATNANAPLVTITKDGFMSKEDYDKLNGILLPPPNSTLTGNKCLSNNGTEIVFRNGHIALYADKFIDVDGTVKLTNINETGDQITIMTPFQIHSYTYGFDFKLDIQQLYQELVSRNQINITGKKGKTGKKGVEGDPGKNYVFSGQQGDKGDNGRALPCKYTMQQESLENVVTEGLNKAIVGAYIKTDEYNPKKYKLVLQRQAVGRANLTAKELKLKNFKSDWMLLTDTAVGTGRLYYVDIKPVIDSIIAQYELKIASLRSYWEGHVELWIKTISELYEQQRAALCCAISSCESRKANTNTRQHIESIAAAAASSGNVKFIKPDPKNSVISKPDECVVSSTKLNSIKIDKLEFAEHEDIIISGSPYRVGKVDDRTVAVPLIDGTVYQVSDFIYDAEFSDFVVSLLNNKSYTSILKPVI